MSFAGPFANLVIATISFAIMKILTIRVQGMPIIYNIVNLEAVREFPILLNIISITIAFLWMFYLLNIMLMFFNLLPFPPLDGGWILRYLLPQTGKRKYDAIYPYGFIILYGLLFLGVIRGILGFIQRFSLGFLGDSLNILFMI